MSKTSTKTFDAVQAVRAVRDALSSEIRTMSVDEENHWLRTAPISDSRLQRLMELAAQQGAPADATHGG